MLFPTYLFQECFPPNIACGIRCKLVCEKGKVLSVRSIPVLKRTDNGFRKKFLVYLMVDEQLIHIKEIFHAAIAFVTVNHCMKLLCYQSFQ